MISLHPNIPGLSTRPIHTAIVSLVFLMVFVTLSGCEPSDSASSQSANGKGNGTQTVQTFAGKTLVIAAPANSVDVERWHPLLEEWSEQSGGGYQIVDYDGSDPSQLLSGTTWKDSKPDLIFFPIQRSAELVASDALAPLDEKQQGILEWFDILPGLRETIASPNGKPTIVPVSSPVMVCYYRNDLLEAANLEPPRTWDDYHKLVTTLEEWAPGLSAVEPWGPEDRVRMFFARSLAYAKHSGHYSLFLDVSNGEPLINTKGFARALQDVARIWSQLAPNSKELPAEQCRNALVSGQAAIGIGWEIPGKEKGRSSPDNESANRSLRCVALPGSETVFNHTADEWQKPSDEINRPTLTGYSGLAAGISSTASEVAKTEAARVLRMLTIDNLSAAFPTSSTSLCRISHGLQSDLWSQSDLAPQESASYTDAVNDSLRSKNVVAEIPCIGRHSLIQIANEELTTWIDKDAKSDSIEATLANIEGRWKEAIAETGVKQVQNSYRQSMGLRKKSE